MLLVRKWFGNNATFGRLYIGGRFCCFTLEDLTRKKGEKVPGRTAIPYGTYPLSLEYWPKYGREYPLLKGVPGFAGIYIHGGQTPDDTRGCLLVGKRIEAGRLVDSATALKEIRAHLEGRTGAKIRITNAQRRAAIGAAITAAVIIVLLIINKLKK